MHYNISNTLHLARTKTLTIPCITGATFRQQTILYATGALEVVRERKQEVGGCLHLRTGHPFQMSRQKRFLRFDYYNNIKHRQKLCSTVRCKHDLIRRMQ